MKNPLYQSFYHHLDIIRHRPSVMIGKKSICLLDLYLSGYQTYAMIHDIDPIYPESPSFADFDRFVKKRYNSEYSTLNWAYILYYHFNEDDEMAFDECFRLLDEFKAQEADLQFTTPKE
ncbi:hypothetical protein [Xanthocytophaga flava]|uniref:hypothetical protein n=1 Tax=Xanthocytophaga flava TaxID=3048013 RepID=UPI0028D3FBE4|nr:hypothetical protein [Xanthocytophaga flavus]MDJ1473360.1 hypothetical protein [Xanthocytophaga flavus]